MSIETLCKLDRSQAAQWAISILLIVFILIIPEQGFYTHQVKLFSAITVFGLALSAFELVPVMFVSVTMPALWVLCGVAPASTVMSPWVSTTFLMIPGAFFMAAALEDCGLMRRAAYFLMCGVRGNYFSLLASIMIVGIILNVLTAGHGYLIIAPLAAGLCVSLGGMNKRLGAGLATAVMLGGCTSHAYTYKSTGWGVLMQLGADYIGPTDITPLGIMLHNWPLFFVSVLILYIVSKWYKPEGSLGEVTYFREQLSSMGKITRKEKVNAIMLTLILLYIFTVKIHKLPINLGFALIPWVVYLPFVQGADKNTIKKMNLPVIFFVAACMSIGSVASTLGLGGVIVDTFQQLLRGSTNPFAILTIIFFVVFFLNFVMTPLAIWALILAPVLLMVTSMGFDPVPFTYAVNVCTEAILMPYECVPYLIVYGFGMISMKDFIKINILRSILFFAGFLLILVPYWMLIGLL